MDTFVRRHVGPRPHDLPEMLATIGAPSLDALIDEAIPASIRRPGPVALPPAESEHAYLTRLRGVAAKNRVLRSFIGLGYYDTITPSVIRRCLFENPSWYTPYTPYQAEIAQGRLESLLNFQTVVCDLTGLPVATASLLDEGTAAGEAMTLLHRVSPKKLTSGGIFLAADTVFPQTLAVLQSRAEPLGIELRVQPVAAMDFNDPNVFGVLLQYPDEQGQIVDPTATIAAAHAAKVLVAVATDLLALTVLTPPGELGADIVLGNSQRFGVPLGYGGPHAAFFATRQEHVRHAPGRIIGVSVDAQGHRAYRMALQTREQHIRREKATSNICTAQALLANMAAMYAVYHGPDGLTAIARRVHGLTQSLAAGVTALGITQTNAHYFDTLRVTLTPQQAAAVRAASVEAGYNLRHIGDTGIGVSLDETATADDVAALVAVFAKAMGKTAGAITASTGDALPPALRRTSAFLTHAVFHTHRSESEMMRYLKALERKDIGLDVSMIALGSCTMKLNAASEMYPVTWTEFSRLHPFVPADQAEGYAEICRELEAALAELTGFAATSLQPNSGAQGELAGLLVIRAWHQDRGEGHRNVVLIPASAHGTNPASAVMAGYKVVVVASDANGNIDVADLKAKAATHSANLAALMVTYPSTHGVFEDAIIDICATVHAHGGQVYMDGANMNAQVGLTSPALIGADVNHINLHKTFAIPHGGGGPAWGRSAWRRTWRRTCRGIHCRRWAATKASCRWRRRHGAARASCSSPTATSACSAARCDRVHQVRHPQRQLHQGAPGRPLRRALHAGQWPRGARDDLRPAEVQGRRRRRRRRGQAPHGLRLPRPHGVVPGARHAHDRTDGERRQGRAGPLLRCPHLDSPGDRRRRHGDGRREGQRAQERAAHGGGGHGRHLGTPLHARAGGVSAALGEGQQVLAERGPHRQSVRRSQPRLHLPADGGVRITRADGPIRWQTSAACGRSGC